MSDSKHPSAPETINYLGVNLRLPGLVEMLISNRDNTWSQLSQCSRWYKGRALRELHPGRKSYLGLTTQQRGKVIDRAIELAVSDSRNGLSVPPLE